MVEENTLHVLSELGLNEYETRAYLAILESGVLVAREISDRSHIPYAKVYQVLDSLIAKNMVIGDEGRPKKFLALSPDESLKNRLKTLKADFDSQHKRRESLVKKIMPDLSNLFKDTKIDPIREEGIFSIIGLSNITTRISKLLDLTNDQILITSNNQELMKGKILKLLGKLENIKIQFRTSSDFRDLPKNFNKHSVSSPENATTLIFDEFAILTIIETQRGKFASGEFLAILNQIPSIVESAILDYKLIIGGDIN